ncbi:MAG: CNP1-like family protein [Burkholderiales bacterium]
MRRLALAAALACACAGCASTPRDESDWERRNRENVPPEEGVSLPAYPVARDLVEFTFPTSTGFRFFIDRKSLAVGKDGVVRYVLVARSPGGPENVTFEGLRCASAEQRVYALGHPDHAWSAARSPWRPLASARHIALYRDYFCPQNKPIRDAGEGVRALESGGHPFAKGLGSQVGR